MAKDIVVHSRAGMTFRDFVSVLFQYKRAAAVTFFGILVIGGLILLNLTPVYEAKSTLLLKVGREYLNRSDLNASAPMMSLSDPELTNSEIQILTNLNSVRKTIEKVGLGRIYPDLAASKLKPDDRLNVAADRFLKSLTVEPVKQSKVVEVSFKHDKPAIAAQAVNALVEIFKEKHLQVFSGPQVAFVEQQLAQYRQKLDQAGAKLEEFKQKNGVSSLDEQRTRLLHQRDSLDTSLKKTVADMRELQEKGPTMQRNLERIGRTVTPYASPDKEGQIEATKAQLLAMQVQEQELLKKYTEQTPMVVSHRKQMAVVQKYLKEQQRELAHRTSIGSPMYQSVQTDLMKTQADLTALQARASTLREQLTEAESQVQDLDLKEKTMQQLKLQQAVNQKNYEMLATKAEEARISEVMDKGKLANISVIQEATAPSEPVEPKKGTFFLRCLALALFGSIAAPFFLRGTNPSLSSPESVERRLGLRVLASISHTAQRSS